MCWGREPSRRAVRPPSVWPGTSCGSTQTATCWPIRRPRYWTGRWCSGSGERMTRSGSRRGRGRSWPSTAGARTVETGGCGSGRSGCSSPSTWPRESWSRQRNSWPVCPRRTGNGPCWRPCSAGNRSGRKRRGPFWSGSCSGRHQISSLPSWL